MRDPDRYPEIMQTAEKEALAIQALRMDVNSDDSVTKTIEAIQQENGPIDVLVNNAGIEDRGSVEELSLARSTRRNRTARMKKYTFKARIEPGRGGGAFVFFPYDVEKEFGTHGRVPVKATFNGLPETGSLMKYGHPQHVMGISKAIREKLGKKPGDTVDVEIWKDEEERTVEVPADFKNF